MSAGGTTGRARSRRATRSSAAPCRHSVETGRWYDVRVEVRGRSVRGYLDGVLINEATFPRVDTVLAIAGRDDRTGDMILKVVNTSGESAAMTVRVNGAASRPAAGASRC